MLSLSKNAFSINICHCPFSQNLLKVVQICGGQYSDWSGFIFKDMAFTIFQRLPQVLTCILSPFSLILYEINAQIYSHLGSEGKQTLPLSNGQDVFKRSSKMQRNNWTINVCVLQRKYRVSIPSWLLYRGPQINERNFQFHIFYLFFLSVLILSDSRHGCML